MSKFKGKYRIESTRLKGWDYSNPAWYYITICTKNRICFLGDVRNERLFLSDIGKIVKEEWQKIETIRTGVELDEFIIMPNHLHGVIIITNDHLKEVETHGHASVQIKQNLSNIIRGFKSASTKKIRDEVNKNFAWQPRFYDHIIRNEKSFYKIRHYIKYNMLK